MLWAEGATNAKTHRPRRACDRQTVIMMGPQRKVGAKTVQADGPVLSTDYAEEFEFDAGGKRETLRNSSGV